MGRQSHSYCGSPNAWRQVGGSGLLMGGNTSSGNVCDYGREHASGSVPLPHKPVPITPRGQTRTPMAPSPFRAPFTPNSSVFPRHRIAKQKTLEAERQNQMKKKLEQQKPGAPGAGQRPSEGAGTNR